LSYSRLVFSGGHRRRARWKRGLRAVWRDSLALWREFRIPLLIFLIVILPLAWLYGELWVLAGYERIPYLTLPFVMLQLMIVEPPESAPPEPYLIVFWYALPVIFVYIVGRGAVDFVRLFFNRGERRNAWEEAVASTYRNHVIVIGVGHVGLRITRTLVQMGFDVVGIDQRIKPEIDAELGKLGVPMIIADGRLPATLERAGLREASALVVCTSNDQINLETTMRARDMNPNIRIVVRMWDNQFAQQLERFMGVQAVLSASDLAAPVFAGAAVGVEISQTLHINGVDYSMIRLLVEQGSFLQGATVGQLQHEHDMDIVLHGHGDSLEVQPHNENLVEGGDMLVIFARHDHIIDIVTRNRRGTLAEN
jgi:Trk K+ transport system NAD-binding subunit